MFKSLALLTLLAVSTAWSLSHNQTTCRIAAVGPSIGGLCPSGYTSINNGDCCSSQQVTSGSNCVDKTGVNGVNECPGLRSYCTQSNSCNDLINPTTGRSDCIGNIGLCNNMIYRESMKFHCPKTCGYCK